VYLVLNSLAQAARGALAMTQDVRQWLAEIKKLQQKLLEAQQERDEAYTGAANWRKLYETEAQQRRTEANLARQSIETLKAELQALRSTPPSTVHPSGDADSQRSELQQQLAQLTPTDLQYRLAEALLECDRLTNLLKEEQENHAQTRKGLTTALGDTVDLLTKERAIRTGHDEPAPSSNGAGLPGLEGAKTPSLELPPVNPAQSLV
jgi:chromosome segregation ATPase